MGRRQPRHRHRFQVQRERRPPRYEKQAQVSATKGVGPGRQPPPERRLESEPDLAGQDGLPDHRTGREGLFLRRHRIPEPGLLLDLVAKTGYGRYGLPGHREKTGRQPPIRSRRPPEGTTEMDGRGANQAWIDARGTPRFIFDELNETTDPCKNHFRAPSIKTLQL